MLNSIVQFLLVALMVAVPFYFQYWMQKAPRQIHAIDSKSSRLCALNLCMMAVSVFMATASKSGTKQIFMAGVSFMSIMMLYSFRGRAIQKLRQIELNPKERFALSLRSFGGITAMLGLNYGIVYALSPFIGTLCSVVIAVMTLIACAPLIVRILYSCQPMHPSPLKDEIRALFQDSNIELAEIYLMNTTKTKVSNAMVCGPRFGFGPLKRSLFLTENLFEVLNEEELKAVLCHEAAHFKLHHVAKRGFASVVLFILAVALIMVPFAATLTLVESSQWSALIVATSILTNLSFQFAFIFRVIRKHEFEADLHAVVLGANPHALVNALEKITFFNKGSLKNDDLFTRIFQGSGHPTVEERSRAILSHRMPDSARILPQGRFIASYIAIVAVIGACYISKSNLRTAERSVASETSNSTR